MDSAGYPRGRTVSKCALTRTRFQNKKAHAEVAAGKQSQPAPTRVYVHKNRSRRTSSPSINSCVCNTQIQYLSEGIKGVTKAAYDRKTNDQNDKRGNKNRIQKAIGQETVGERVRSKAIGYDGVGEPRAKPRTRSSRSCIQPVAYERGQKGRFDVRKSWLQSFVLSTPFFPPRMRVAYAPGKKHRKGTPVWRKKAARLAGRTSPPKCMTRFANPRDQSPKHIERCLSLVPSPSG